MLFFDEIDALRGESLRSVLRQLRDGFPSRPVRVTNPIYREVIARVLGNRTEDSVVADPRPFVLPDGRLDFHKLVTLLRA